MELGGGVRKRSCEGERLVRDTLCTGKFVRMKEVGNALCSELRQKDGGGGILGC